MPDVTSPLNQLEAGRVKTEAEEKYGKKIKYRYLVGYTPEQVAARFGFKANDVAKMAGRSNGTEKG